MTQLLNLLISQIMPLFEHELPFLLLLVAILQSRAFPLPEKGKVSLPKLKLEHVLFSHARYLNSHICALHLCLYIWVQTWGKLERFVLEDCFRSSKLGSRKKRHSRV